MGTFKNIFACAVHERPECVEDLVQNLHCLDPDSPILLYDGREQTGFLASMRFPFERYNVFIHPEPRPVRWAKLHEFAIESIRWAIEQGPFDAVTFVDSDQLMLRPGYTQALATHVAPLPQLGLLGSTGRLDASRSKGSRAALVAWREVNAWRPLMKQLPDGESSFVQFTFWPSTVFLADACRALLKLWDGNLLLRQLMSTTSIWPTEEIVLPTLVAALGFDIASSPFRSTYVRYRTGYSLPTLERALRTPNAFWMHPIPRRYDDPLRSRIRERFQNYENATAAIGPDLVEPPRIVAPQSRRPRWATAQLGSVRQVPRAPRLRLHGTPRVAASPRILEHSSNGQTIEPSSLVRFDDASSQSPNPARCVRVYTVSSSQRADLATPSFVAVVSPRGLFAHADASIGLFRKRREDWVWHDYMGVFDGEAWDESGLSRADLAGALERTRFQYDAYALSSPARSNVCQVASRAHPLGERLARHLLIRRLGLPERILDRNVPFIPGGLWLARPKLFEKYMRDWLIPIRSAFEDSSDTELARLLDGTATPVSGRRARQLLPPRDGVVEALLGCLAPMFFSYLACRQGFFTPSAAGTSSRYSESKSVPSR